MPFADFRLDYASQCTNCFWKQPEIPSHLRFGSKQLSVWYIKAFEHTNSPTRSKPWLFPEGGVEDNSAWMTEHEDKARTTCNSRVTGRAPKWLWVQRMSWLELIKERSEGCCKAPAEWGTPELVSLGDREQSQWLELGLSGQPERNYSLQQKICIPFSLANICIHADRLNSVVLPTESQSWTWLLGEGCALSQLCCWPALCTLGDLPREMLNGCLKSSCLEDTMRWNLCV